MPRPATLDHLRSAKKPVTDQVVIALDSSLADEYATAKQDYEFAKARLQGKPDDVNLQSRYEEAEEKYIALHDEMEENSAIFTFRSMGRIPYEELVAEHQPTKSQRDEARRLGNGSLTYNPDTFPPALLAASAVEPPMTETEAKELWNDPAWNQSELLTLFFCAMGVNQNRRIVDLGKG